MEKGFDFVGYHFSDTRLGVAKKTIENCVEKITQLYEQGADDVRIGEYLWRWVRWVAKRVGVLEGA